ncbi:hypothetical protein Acr_09g0000900 [Actinidia rufa]|uniref:Mur ligase central domain-containing protein n=1 Tax=Actinidia rufa TaxID=165716 RepID=A0A7J0F4N8_9ERIC|nr:hypothetical protein Acr_09g0000900 [Actinidia rufa]
MKQHCIKISHGHGTLTLKPNDSANKTKRIAIRACLPNQDLNGQSVAVVGLGKSGIAAVRLALARGASVLAVDQNENLDPLEQNPLFETRSSVKTVLVPLETYGLSLLLQSGKRVMSELDFAAEVLPRCTKILAVTGTNGKSTVTTFAGQMLNHLDIKAFVGGNLGVPLSEAALQCLKFSPKSNPFKVVVVEVSSYQLEIPHKYFCPSVAVILNLTPDHLERHKTMENYALTKCRIFSRMSNSKMGVLPLVMDMSPPGVQNIHYMETKYLNDAVRSFANDINLAWVGAFPGVRVRNINLLCILFTVECNEDSWNTQLYHNAAVAALAVIGLDIGIDAKAIDSTIDKLKVPPHRMQVVHRDNNGVVWVDDSKATNVEATYTGLVGLKGQKSVVLLGGIAKICQGSSGFERLLEPLKCHRGVVTVYKIMIYELTRYHVSMKFGSSGMMIQKTLSANGLNIPCVRATNLEEAVKEARSMTRYGSSLTLVRGLDWGPPFVLSTTLAKVSAFRSKVGTSENIES